MAKIASFNAACKVLKMKPVVPKFLHVPKEERKALVAHYVLVTITRASNGNRKFNWKSDNNQPKYEIWWEMDGNNGFCLGGVCDCYARSTVGSRLCFFNREDAEYAAKKHYNLYKDYFTQ